MIQKRSSKKLPRISIHILHAHPLVVVRVVEGSVRQRGVAVSVTVSEGGVAVHPEGVSMVTRPVVAQLVLRVLVPATELTTHARVGVTIVTRGSPAPSRCPAH